MNGRSEDSARLHELLADWATGDITPVTAAELASLAGTDSRSDERRYEQAVAAIDAALAPATPEPMPEALRLRIRADGRARVRGLVAFRSPAPAAAGTASWAGPRPIRAWAGWAVAAVIAGIALLPRGQDAPAPSAPEPSGVALTLVAPDAVRLPWTATEDVAAQGAGGEVVWSAERNGGAMVIRGLAANDPAQAQYQLWIFDATRDERYPVDGGVFDVPAGAEEVVIPIDAKVPVREAVLFAVTVERPGGVVVSDRERIVLVARPAGAG